jgi:hypothetical protein
MAKMTTIKTILAREALRDPVVFAEFVLGKKLPAWQADHLRAHFEKKFPDKVRIYKKPPVAFVAAGGFALPIWS